MVFPTEDEVLDYMNSITDLEKWGGLTAMNVTRANGRQQLDNPNQILIMESEEIKFNQTDKLDVVVSDSHCICSQKGLSNQVFTEYVYLITAVKYYVIICIK